MESLFPGLKKNPFKGCLKTCDYMAMRRGKQRGREHHKFITHVKKTTKKQTNKP